MSDPIRKPDEFPSRSESILSDTIGLEGYSIETPSRSRIEHLLIELKEIIGQGGGGSSTAYATSLEITMDEYFVMSATLKNKDGDTLGQVQTVDLPLESVVVNGSYDSVNKNVVLTLENGNTVSFSVADLVSGLQTEITSNNKLDADLVDDANSTHKFATEAQLAQIQINKTALDNKADKSTTYTKIEVDTALSAKANSADVYSKTAVDTALGDKVDKETGKGLSTNDYTTAEKTKLDIIAEIKTIGTGLDLDSNGKLTATGGGTTNYNDLSNKPQINGNTLSGNKTSAQLGLASVSDIPTVPITAIQKNGTGIMPLNGTVNITVPTTAADVSALPTSTKYATTLSLTINSSTFVMTGQLKDQNGDNLGTAQTIDLPLESVVVGGSYNSQTKKVVLTLQNGNTIEFSVADLVSGLQTELSASNKLNPAYINYDSAHRAVSDTEKSTWNSKQSALSSTQLDAVNSGIDSTKVAQIETNKNNILSLYTQGVKNIAKPNTISATSDITIVQNMGHYEISGTTGGSQYTVYLCTPTEDIIATEDLYIPAATTRTNVNYMCHWKNTQDVSRFSIIGTGLTIPQGCKIHAIYIQVAANTTFSLNADMMICKKAIYDADPSYQPYAMSNAELTEEVNTAKNNISKDEAAIAELVDANRRKVYANTEDSKSYTFSNLYGLNESRFKYALVCGGGTANNPALAMVWFVFIDNSGVVTTRKISGDSPRALTGSVSGTTLTLTSDSTMYGGLRLIWLS